MDNGKRLFWQVANEVCPGYSAAGIETQLNDVVRWALRMEGPHDPDKGFWIYGPSGSGKTTLLEIIRKFCAVVRPPFKDGYPYGFRLSSCHDVAKAFNDDGLHGIATYIDNRRQAFDDLGTEPRQVHYFGTLVTPMTRVLLGRYDKRHRVDDFTHVTTNMASSEVERLYGRRVAERITEMFNPIKLDGVNHRHKR